MNAQLLKLTDAEYFAIDDRASSSSLKVLRDNPANYYAEYIAGTSKRESTKAMDIGTVFHDLIRRPAFVVDEENYRRWTIAVWIEIHLDEDEISVWPSMWPPDYISGSGSVYWYADDGVYRQSDHWGTVGRCVWELSGANVMDTAPRTGFCAWRDFLYSESFVPIPSDVLSARGAREGAAWKQFLAENPGRILLKPDEYAPLPRMLASVRSHDRAPLLMDAPGGLREHAILWEDKDTGLDMKAKLDLWIPPPVNIVVDYKSTRDASPEGFARQILDNGLHCQGHVYADAVEALTGERPSVVFIAIESGEPHLTGVYSIHEDWKQMAAFQVRNDLRELKQRLASGDWLPWWARGEHELAAPNRAKYQNEYAPSILPAVIE